MQKLNQMKNSNYTTTSVSLYGFLLTGIVVISSCMKDNYSKLSISQLNAVQLLKSSYENAKMYNDSLIYAATAVQQDSAIMHYLDSKYHYYDFQFDSCHNLYEHNNISADHSHNSMGAAEAHNAHNSMMSGCQCCTNGGHDIDIHRQMAALREQHARYHPH